MNKPELDEFVRLQDYCWEYLKESFDKKWHLGSELIDFRDTHGEMAISSMVRFVEWARENDKVDTIQGILLHDVTGANDSSMVPKTSGY